MLKKIHQDVSIRFLWLLFINSWIFVFFLTAIGRLCEKDDGKCVICDSYVRPCTLVRICDECNYGSYQGRCVICGGPGVSDAYYCKECTIQEKDVSFNQMKYRIRDSLSQTLIFQNTFREMVVQRLLTWVVQRPICSTSGRSLASNKDNVFLSKTTLLYFLILQFHSNRQWISISI